MKTLPVLLQDLQMAVAALQNNTPNSLSIAVFLFEMVLVMLILYIVG